MVRWVWRKQRLRQSRNGLLPTNGEWQLSPAYDVCFAYRHGSSGERQLQSHILNGLSELFDLDYKEMQIQLLNRKIDEHFGNEPFYNEALNILVKQKNK